LNSKPLARIAFQPVNQSTFTKERQRAGGRRQEVESIFFALCHRV